MAATLLAAFAEEEARWAKYTAWGGHAPGQVLPGMNINPIFPSCWVGLTIGTVANLHTAAQYPNPYATTGALNATWEPTNGASGQYAGYLPLKVNRYNTVWNVTQSGGHWQISNKNALTFATAGAGSTGCTITGATFCIVDKADDNLRYLWLCAQLDTPLAVVATTTPAWNADELVFIWR